MVAPADRGDDPHAQRRSRRSPQNRTGDHQPAPPESRQWRHPSELGHSHRVEADRRRSSLLVLGLVVIGAGVLIATTVATAHWSTTTDDEPSSDGTPPGVDDSLARIEVVDRPDVPPVTGIVVDDAGHVVVPLSALEGASALRAHCGGAYADAALVAIDAREDMALLRVSDPHGEVPESAEPPQVGDPLTLVRFDPDGHRWTRQVVVRDTEAAAPAAGGAMTHDLLAADGAAAPNGVLADAHGRMAGWVTAARADGVTATDPSVFMAHVQELIEHGRIDHGWIGVRASDTVGDGGGGATVLDVAEGSPAQQAGLVPGDVVVSADGTPVTSLSGLTGYLDHTPPGDTVRLGVRRGDQHHQMVVTVSESP